MGDLIGGIFGALGGNDSQAPPARNLSNEVADLNNQSSTLFGNEYQYAPQYVALGKNMLGSLLPYATGVYNAANTASRTATARDFSRLAPMLAGLSDKLDPNTGALLSRLNGTATTGLDEGSSLSPDDISKITSSERADWSNRGLGGSNPALLDEATRLATSGEGVRQNRQQFAANVAGLDQQHLAPLYSILTGVAGSNSPSLSLGDATINRYALAPNVFSQLGNYANSVYGGNYQGQLQSNLNNSQMSMHAWDSISKGVNSLAGFAGGMCWAAREVFGADNPKWKQFRHWMLFVAPEKFRHWYIANGEKWAAWLRDNPNARTTVRRWMERRLSYGG